MRVFVFVLMILGSSFAGQLVLLDDVEALLVKYMKNELTEADNKSLHEIFEILHRTEHVSTKSLEYSSLTRMTLDCLICRSAFAVAFDNVKSGQTDEEISAVIITLCVSLGIENFNVCHGAVTLNMPIITHIIRNVPEAAPGTFCGLVLQEVHNSNVCPFTDARFEWQVELPEPSVAGTVPITDDRPFKAVVITDAHIDPLYEAYGVAECDEPTCCRIGQSPAHTYLYKAGLAESIIDKSVVNVSGNVMLDLSVASKLREMKMSKRTRFTNSRNAKPAGYWGDYRNCDTPLWAFDDVIDRITETHKDIDVVYYIGDTIDHGVWETSYKLIDDMNRYIAEKIRKSFGDDVLVVPVIGNHESQPTNQFAPSSVTDPKLNTTWLYKALVNKWGYYLTEEAKESLVDRGDFSMLVRPGLRVISLNNNVAYKYNWWLVYDPSDAKRHLDWLVQELYKAESAGEKVHLLAHIPPGVHDLIYTWTREYNRIVNRFSSTIMAEFNGHTHSDEFKVFYSNRDGSPINVAWGAGSTTTYTFYNLNYKIVDFDTQSFEPLNMVNYVYNLTEANLTPNRRPHWFQLYDMKNTFGLTDLSASSLDNLVQRMVTTDKHLLDMYSAFFSKLSDSRWPYCNNNCKLDNLCKTVVTVLWERERCEEVRDLFYR